MAKGRHKGDKGGKDKKTNRSRGKDDKGDKGKNHNRSRGKGDKADKGDKGKRGKKIRKFESQSEEIVFLKCTRVGCPYTETCGRIEENESLHTFCEYYCPRCGGSLIVSTTVLNSRLQIPCQGRAAQLGQ